jgi:hypothetical protein
LDEALAWAGASAALVVLSHDPHVDVAAIAIALDRGVPYIGAMGSRRTQSRRMERLQALGRSETEIDRIHRPIGLDLGGRSAPEVALRRDPGRALRTGRPAATGPRRPDPGTPEGVTESHGSGFEVVGVGREQAR